MTFYPRLEGCLLFSVVVGIHHDYDLALSAVKNATDVSLARSLSAIYSSLVM